jgi:large subunit ribosomal protein L29
MKMKDLRELTKDELLTRHDTLWGDLFGMRIKHTLGQLENPMQLRAARRDIARVRTLLRQQGVVEVARPRRQVAAATQAVVEKARARKTKAKATRAKAAEKGSDKARSTARHKAAATRKKSTPRAAKKK